MSEIIKTVTIIVNYISNNLRKYTNCYENSSEIDSIFAAELYLFETLFKSAQQSVSVDKVAAHALERFQFISEECIELACDSLQNPKLLRYILKIIPIQLQYAFRTIEKSGETSWIDYVKSCWMSLSFVSLYSAIDKSCIPPDCWLDLYQSTLYESCGLLETSAFDKRIIQPNVIILTELIEETIAKLFP